MNDYYWLIVGPLTSHVKCPPNYMAMLSILLSLTFSIVTHESVLLLLILLFNLQQVNRSSNAIEILDIHANGPQSLIGVWSFVFVVYNY